MYKMGKLETSIEKFPFITLSLAADKTYKQYTLNTYTHHFQENEKSVFVHLNEDV